MTGRTQEKSLYERVGGYNALAAVVDDFIGRLVSDKQFEKFFIGHSIIPKRRFASTFSISFVRPRVDHVFTPDAT
jgi:truncated hemoglobin YjbI